MSDGLIGGKDTSRLTLSENDIFNTHRIKNKMEVTEGYTHRSNSPGRGDVGEN